MGGYAGYSLLEHSPEFQSTRKLALLRIPDRQFFTFFEGHH